MAKRHESALQDCQSRPHQVKLLEREHSEERKVCFPRFPFVISLALLEQQGQIILQLGPLLFADTQVQSN